jgi:hypothetical protein
MYLFSGIGTRMRVASVNLSIHFGNKTNIAVPNLQLRSSSQAVKVTPCKGSGNSKWFTNVFMNT